MTPEIEEDGLDFVFETKKNIIKVIGVGGGGGNAASYMYTYGIHDVDFIIANTDQQALQASPIPVKVPLGATLTEGLGAGNNPENGKQAAIESIEDIKTALNTGTKMLFVTAGMGGGTGTGAAPEIARTAKEMGILTVAIVTIPFRYEGPKRVKQALEGLKQLSQSVDAMLVIDNEKIREMYGNMPARQAFAKADDILTMAAKGIAEIITVPGEVNVDFADVKAVMQDSGVALMGRGEADGEDRALNAVKAALNSPLLNDSDIKGAKNMLVNIISSSENETTLDEVSIINEYVQNSAGQAGDGGNLIWGQTKDENLGSKICVTLIATGFDKTGILNPYERPVGQKIQITPAAAPKTPEPAKPEPEKTEPAPAANTAHKAGDEVEFEIEPDNTDDSASDTDEPEETEQSSEAVIQSKFQKINFNDIQNLDEMENQPAFERKGIKISFDIPKDVKKFPLSEE